MWKARPQLRCPPHAVGANRGASLQPHKSFPHPRHHRIAQVFTRQHAGQTQFRQHLSITGHILQAVHCQVSIASHQLTLQRLHKRALTTQFPQIPLKPLKAPITHHFMQHKGITTAGALGFGVQQRYNPSGLHQRHGTAARGNPIRSSLGNRCLQNAAFFQPSFRWPSPVWGYECSLS